MLKGKTILDSEPTITIYEEKIISASYACNSITDIHHYSKILNIKDVPEFLELVLICKAKVKSYGNT